MDSWVCPECGPVRADKNGRCWNCDRDASPNQAYLATLTARVEKAEDIINEACALLKSPDMTNDGGCGLVDDIECLRHNYNAALDDLERVERERDEARARLAAAREAWPMVRAHTNFFMVKNELLAIDAALAGGGKGDGDAEHSKG